MLLMDEPLASLDDERKAEIYPYIERLRDDGRVPIVFVTHSVAEIARLATTIVVLENGRVIAAGAASDVLRDVTLFPAFGAGEAGVVLEARVEAHDEEFGLTVLSGQVRSTDGSPHKATNRDGTAFARPRPRCHRIGGGAEGPQRPERTSGADCCDRNGRRQCSILP